MTIIQDFNILAIDSLSEMEEVLRRRYKNGNITHIMGEGISDCYIVEFSNMNLSIGICTSQLKLRDECIIQDTDGNIMIGFDQYLVWLRKDQNYAPQVLKDAFLVCFYTFLELKDSQILAIFELSAIKTDFSGHVAWRIDFNDVVMDYRIDNDEILSVTFMEGGEKEYNLESGNQMIT